MGKEDVIASSDTVLQSNGCTRTHVTYHPPELMRTQSSKVIEHVFHNNMNSNTKCTYVR